MRVKESKTQREDHIRGKGCSFDYSAALWPLNTGDTRLCPIKQELATINDMAKTAISC